MSFPEWRGFYLYGLDGKKRDFREVYEILNKHFYLKALIKKLEKSESKVSDEKKKKPENYEKTLAVAVNNAWNRTVRTFRGSNQSKAGVCYTKDIIYRQGNIAVWQLIGKKPEELFRLSVGKYDPANPRHIWILDQLGISEKDLENLDTSLKSEL